MLGVIKLVRPFNLIIIAVTMYSIRTFLVVYEKVNGVQLLNKHGEGFDFFLLVVSTVLIAAAGNAINDYFDIKADRVNRPEKMVIGKYLTRRKAILVHWFCNILAFTIALALSLRNSTFWYVFIHLLSINALWLYSLYFQKKPLLGNLVIAGLTAMVPILCGVHFFIQQSFVWTRTPTNTDLSYWLQIIVVNGKFIALLAFFAFFNNFSREIIKDIEDIPGDREMEMKTLPIALGKRNSKKIVVGLLLAPVILFLGLACYLNGPVTSTSGTQLLIFAPVILSILSDCMAVILVIRAQNRKQFIRADQFVKLAMIFGIITPFFWLALSM